MRCTQLVRGNRCANRATVDDRCAAHAPGARIAALKAAVVAATMRAYHASWQGQDFTAMDAACAALAKAEKE